MTTFENLTRRAFITIAVVFGLYAGWTLKEDMLHRIRRLERERLLERRRSEKESMMIRLADEPKPDEREASTSYDEDPASDLL
jgi:hypothetical protein